MTTSSRITRGLTWSAASSFSIRIGNFLVSIIMARLIAPEEYGVFAVALTVWSVLGTVAEFGLGTDVVRSREPQRIIPTVATVGMLTSAGLGLSMAAGAPLIAASFESPESTSVVRVMSLGMIVIGLSIVPAALLQRAYRQGTLFAVNGAGLIASTGTMTVLAVNGYGPMALAIGHIVGQTVVVTAMYAVTRQHLRFGFDPSTARDSIRFCMPLAAANLVSWLLLAVDNVIVARGLGQTQLGLYVLAFNVSSWPMNAVGQAVRVVALPALSEVTDRAQRARALLLVTGPVCVVAVTLGIGLSTMASPIIRLLYGERWAPAAAALVGLAVFGAMRVVFDLVATFLVASGRTRAVLVVQLVWLASMVPVMIIGVRLGGLAGAGWAHVVVGLVVVIPAYVITLRGAGVAVRPLLWAAFPALAWSPFAIVTCWFIAQRVGSPWVGLPLAGLACLVLYVLPLTGSVLRSLRLLRGEPSE